MTKDLSLSVTNTATTPPTTDTSRLSWATSLFYFGMLAGLYPMTFALQRFNLGRILGGVVIFWALICKRFDVEVLDSADFALCFQAC